ncbi:MAG: hypothetical protein QOI78_8175 [Actinomycetota bacterium]|jgi:hypothetical protein|nr:hypothetical protein [Actinomycetota bacterium]
MGVVWAMSFPILLVLLSLLAVLVDDEAGGAPPRTRVDLDAGKFVIREH